MANFAPNVLQRIIDRSLGVIQPQVGAVGFVTGAQWGPCLKIQTVTSSVNLYEKFGAPDTATNATSWYQIAQHVDYYNASAKVIRAVADATTTINAGLVVNTDGQANLAWDDGSVGTALNGTDEPRKLHEDYSNPSITMIALSSLKVAEVSGFAPGATISSNNIDPGSGIVVARSASSGAGYLYIKDVAGTFASGDSLDDVSPYVGAVTTASADAVANMDQLVYFYAKYPGTGGNDIKVAMSDEENFATATYDGTNTIASAVSNKINIQYITVKLVCSGTSGAFTLGETVTGSVSGSTGVVDRIVGDNVYVKDVAVSKFQASETITGGSSSATATITKPYTDLAIVVLKGTEVKEAHVVSTHTSDITLQGNQPKFIDYWLRDNSEYVESISKTTGNSIDKFGQVSRGVSENTGFFQGTLLTLGASAEIVLADAQVAYNKIFADKQNSIYLVSDLHAFGSYSASNYNTLLAHIQSKAEITKKHFVISTLPKAAISDSSFSISDINASVVGINSKYVAIYTQWKEIYDIYNRTKYFIPLSGDIAGIHAITIRNYGSWEAPFGNEKGLLRNCTKLYHDLEFGDDTATSQLAEKGINNVIYKDGIGNVVWGNSTRYNTASDLSEINVVHTLTEDMTAMAKVLDSFISYNINDATFALIRNAIDRGYLEGRAAKGAYNQIDGDLGYLFVCDTTNNTAATIKSNQLICDFYVKPAKAVKYVILTAIITPAGVSFADIASA